MSMKWYVVHTYSGYENKAKTALEEAIRASGKEELFSEIMVPAEDVVEMVRRERKTSKRKFFPGYILIRMELNEESWHIVKNTPKITGFVGGNINPPSIPDEQVQRITAQIGEGALHPKPKVLFEEGENVRVIDGPFTNFNGVVEEVKPDKGKLKVLVSIFGRATPIELEFGQVEKG